MLPAIQILLLLLAGVFPRVNPHAGEQLGAVWAELPRGVVALGGDVHVTLHQLPGVPVVGGLSARLVRSQEGARVTVVTLPLALDAHSRFTLPCGHFSRGGTYHLQLIVDDADHLLSDYDSANSTDDGDGHPGKDATGTEGDSEERVVKSWELVVSWPVGRMSVIPERTPTYPERAVTAIVEFPDVTCDPAETGADFWLELVYCGRALCDTRNASDHFTVLYSEQMHAFVGRRTMSLRCELFGRAGQYALTLRPAAAASTHYTAQAFIQADWSEQFVLNVHGGSVLPCGGGGVRVLFQYPECALEGADRVRVFGRDSAARLRYVAERRVRRGQHTASFDCQLFSERYPEYCFVYVSVAVTGAVADVRMDCLPTLPLSEGGAGGWGEWSAWSACPAPAQCSVRTRSRHRFCDSPPPSYGAHYCEGRAVELAACECHGRPWPGDSGAVVAEVGPRCRCGCVLHLAPMARLVAGSARACPARSFWLLQAEEGFGVVLRLESVRLRCAGQSLRVRDGDSLGSPLLAAWDGPRSAPVVGESVVAPAADGVGAGAGAIELAGGRHILVELRSLDTSERCAGGFLAHATQMESMSNVSSAWAGRVGDSGWLWAGGGARAAAAALAGAALLSALALALQSATRRRAYHRAADKDDLTDSDACSASLQLVGGGSRSTLLSEVVGVAGVMGAAPAGSGRHTRLMESDFIADHIDTRDEEEEVSDEEAEQHTGSLHTVTPEEPSSEPAAGVKAVPTPSPLRRARTVSASNVNMEQMSSLGETSQSDTATAELSTSVSSVSEREDTVSARDSGWERDSHSRASSTASTASTASNTTLTNGWYSPAPRGVVSAARVRDNPKRHKETSNRRLLRSDLSLTSHPEMEIDYYDYEVNNAGSVPGSYLGMDPAFLVWIPPLDDGDVTQQFPHDTNMIYENAVPPELRPDPGSNSESPEERPSSSVHRARSHRSNDSVRSDRKLYDQPNIIHPLNFSVTDLDNSPRAQRKATKTDEIPLRELTGSPGRAFHGYDSSTLKRVRDNVRETSSDSLKMSDLSDIRYADDSESSTEIKFADDSPDSNRLLGTLHVPT